MAGAVQKRLVTGSLIGGITGLWAGLEGSNIHTGGPGVLIVMLVIFISMLGSGVNGAFWAVARARGEDSEAYVAPLALYLSALVVSFAVLSLIALLGRG